MNVQHLEKLNQQKAKIDNTIKALDFIPAELENVVKVSVIGLPELDISLPWDFSELARVRRLLGRNWRFASTWSNVGEPVQREYIFRCFEYRCKAYPEARLTISIRYESGQTTCQLKQVSTRELPVYEIVCN